VTETDRNGGGALAGQSIPLKRVVLIGRVAGGILIPQE